VPAEREYRLVPSKGQSAGGYRAAYWLDGFAGVMVVLEHPDVQVATLRPRHAAGRHRAEEVEVPMLTSAGSSNRLECYPSLSKSCCPSATRATRHRRLRRKTSPGS
jgi:hypothetical protein